MPNPRESTRPMNIGDTERTLSLVVGGLLALYGLTRRSTGGLLLAAIGGAFVARGATGRDPLFEALGASEEDSERPPWDRTLKVRRSITIQKPRSEVFGYWHNFENLPIFMRHLEKVTVQDARRSHWVARGPAGHNVEWDADVVQDRENELIAWRSTPESEVQNSGSVRFLDAPGGRGTEVHVELEYHPPAGVLGAAVARLLGEEPHGQIHDDLNRLRAILETGEAPTIQGQPSDVVRKTKGVIGTRLLGPGLPRGGGR